MKTLSREGARRREMRGALPPQPPRREGGCPHFKPGTHASLSVADPSLTSKGRIAHKPFALQYGFETRARRVNRGIAASQLGGGWDPAGCVTTEASGCSRFDGSNAQVRIAEHPQGTR